MTKGFRAATCSLLASVSLLAGGWSPAASAGSVPAGKPESVGLSSERLQRVHTAMQGQITIFFIQGGQAAVARTAFENAVRQAIVN